MNRIDEILPERKNFPKRLEEPEPSVLFESNVRTGRKLDNFRNMARVLLRRECYKDLDEFMHSPPNAKVLILCGLRHTGKTTLIRQYLLFLPDEELENTAFIQVSPESTLAAINRDLYRLEDMGIRNVFIDEVTLLDDFIDGAAIFSDFFAPVGMKIVLSGDDSLGFIFSAQDQLYDRCQIIHTTFIPYREFVKVLGIEEIDRYIECDGTMSAGGKESNNPFQNAESAGEYIASAIVNNIQYSVKNYQYGPRLDSLEKLANEISRVVEDINYRFVMEVLNRDFGSNDLKVASASLWRSAVDPADALEILNRLERKTELQEVRRAKIEEYLHLLDLVDDIPVYSLPWKGLIRTRTVLTQPGLRYAQACQLIETLMEDLQSREQVKQRMIEDIILLETKIAYPDKRIFVLQFDIGQFDMVVFSPKSLSCQIFEVKDSQNRFPSQYRDLIDPQKRELTEFRFGKITGQYVLYRGPSGREGKVEYVNLEEYLKGLVKP